jgi:DNA invertase Pin-like site-specific DNA recombinase
LGRPKQVGDGKGARIKVTPEQESINVRLKSESESISAIPRATNMSRPTIYSILSQSEGQDV